VPCEESLFVLDASVITTFGKNGEFRILEEALAGRAYVTDEVYDEVRSVRLMLDAALASGAFLPMHLSTTEELDFFAETRLRMDPGEASAVAGARSLGGIVVSDDGDAIKVGTELLGDGRVIGTRDVLCFAVGHGLIAASQASVHLMTFIRGGAYVPEVDPDFFDGCET
jgi:predicted nucleic acid-binding protein